MNDLTLIKIIGNLNEYEESEQKSLFRIIKYVITYAGEIMNSGDTSLSSEGSEIADFVLNNLHYIVEAVIDNIRNQKSDSIAPIAGKLLRRIIKFRVFYENILSFPFLSEIYFYAKSANFLIKVEAFKIINVRYQLS